MAAFAAELKLPSRREARGYDPLELMLEVNSAVYRAIDYVPKSTRVDSPADDALKNRQGVCQDYSHIAIALSRACGLPARYVSGHLLGEGATHAWVEFLVPAGRDNVRVVSLDPTNGCATNLRYIVVAIGRDYDDVAPTSGVYVGRVTGSIDSHQSVRVTDVLYAA